MKQKTVTIIVALAVLIVLVLVGRYGFTVVKSADVEKAAQSEKFDPVAYVDGIWSSKLLPSYDKAVELSKILSEMQTDASGIIPKESLIAVTNKYGLITVGDAHVYMVKGSGKVTNVKADTSLGTVEVTLDGYSGPIKTLVYIGTRLPSDDSSVRDAVGFITLGNFKDQIEYGQAGSEINNRVLSQVLNHVDKNNLMGKTISFTGAFTIRTQNIVTIKLADVRIVPIEIKFGE